MATLSEDIRKAAAWIAEALKSSGYRADFSLGSLREIDRFFDEHSRDGEAVAGGLLAEHLGQRIFAIGSYVGEVARRAYGGTWECNDNDAEGEVNAAVRLSDGSVIWPIQRVMKRFKHGDEEGIYVYGALLGGDAPQLSPTANVAAQLPVVSVKSSRVAKQPWWKFW